MAASLATSSSNNAAAHPRVDFSAHPSEQELILAYLLPRVSSDDNQPCPFIHDVDVYSLSPAELTNDFAPALAYTGDKAWYFFSALRAKSPGGQRKSRTVDTGGGYWQSEAGAKPVVMVFPEQRRLGHRRIFSFVTKVDGRRVRSGWLMVEIGLDGNDDTVLCKIYFSPRAAARKRKAAAADLEDKIPAPIMSFSSFLK